MAFVIGTITVVWAVLFGTAYLSRFRLGLGRGRSALLVLAAYLVLGAAVLAWFGVNGTGLLAALGMSLPCAAAILLIAILPGRA